MKKIVILFLLSFQLSAVFPQRVISDSTITLDSAIARSFSAFEQRASIPVTSLCCSVPVRVADFSSKTSMVNGLNSVAGVRMEERSPGSYRLNIRGSSLRSPFGVRNIKVYWNDIPITDPGGNTYFNQFAWNNFSDIYIHKGPAGSMYGAGTGGLINLNTFSIWKPGARIEYIRGTYDLENLFADVSIGNKDSKSQITFAHNSTDGYRIHTKMRRDNFSWVSQIEKGKYQLTASLLYTDLFYQTPGALTLAEYNNNPKSARPAGGGFPSAITAKAAIYQKNFLAGFSNLFRLAQGFKNTTTLYGAFAQIKNPAIRNYERRLEPSFGGRTVFNYFKKINKIRFEITGGAEIQHGYFNTQVSKNKNGNPDTLQTNDDINNTAFSYFGQLFTNIDENWIFTTGISANRTRIEIIRRNSYPVISQSRVYKNEITPRLSVLKNFKPVRVLISAAKGFSPPTTAEVLPSTGVISTFLEAERGWNYEISIQSNKLVKYRLKLELTAFSFNLKNALVQRRDLSGADFFVNAGNAKQKGIEFHADYKGNIFGNIFRNFSIRTDVTLNSFRYGNFFKGADDFSGRKLPSVPSSVLSILGDIYLKNGIYFRTTYYGSSFIYLNDANSAKAEPYHLLGMQLGFMKKIKNQYELNIYSGADNLLDETYSLGNDINAAANRFYNAAPRRNFYVGLSFQWVHKPKN